MCIVPLHVTLEHEAVVINQHRTNSYRMSVSSQANRALARALCAQIVTFSCQSITLAVALQGCFARRVCVPLLRRTALAETAPDLPTPSRKLAAVCDCQAASGKRSGFCRVDHVVPRLSIPTGAPRRRFADRSGPPADYYGSTHAPTHAEESAQRRRGPKFEGLKIKTEMREDPYAEQLQKQSQVSSSSRRGSEN